MYDLEGSLDESRTRSIGMEEDRAPRACIGSSDDHTRAFRLGVFQALVPQHDVELEAVRIIDVQVERRPQAVTRSRFRVSSGPRERREIEDGDREEIALGVALLHHVLEGAIFEVPGLLVEDDLQMITLGVVPDVQVVSGHTCTPLFCRAVTYAVTTNAPTDFTTTQRNLSPRSGTRPGPPVKRSPYQDASE